MKGIGRRGYLEAVVRLLETVDVLEDGKTKLQLAKLAKEFTRRGMGVGALGLA